MSEGTIIVSFMLLFFLLYHVQKKQRMFKWIQSALLSFSNHDHMQLARKVIASLSKVVKSEYGALFTFEEGRGYVLRSCFRYDFPTQEPSLENSAFFEHLKKTKKTVTLSLEYPSEHFMHHFYRQVKRFFPWAKKVVPLFHGTQLFGFAILSQPHAFSAEKLLQTWSSVAGRQAGVYLLEAQNREALIRARQFEDRSRQHAFNMHDLKNVASQLRLIQSNKEKYASNPAFIKSVYHTIEKTTEKIDTLIDDFCLEKENDSLQCIALTRLLEKVITLTSSCVPIPRLEWHVAENEVTIMGEPDKLICALCHLVENAQQATAPDGEVILSVFVRNNHVTILVQDNGCGMDSAFIYEGLYQPFVTTKTKGIGIGVCEAKEYVTTMGGKLSVESKKNQGSTFCLEFPVAVQYNA